VFLTHFHRYLETLESKLSEHDRLQARVRELEARLREVDPIFNGPSRPSNTQHFLTPPESTNLQAQSSANISPTHEPSQSQSLSPHQPPYPEDRPSDIPTSNPVLQGLGGGVQADQDANADPGVFEAGDAGKGWYLGCASGSIYYSFSYSLIAIVVYMNSIKNTASSGSHPHFLLALLTLVLGIELDLSEFSPLSRSVSGKSIPSLLSELHSHRSRKPGKPVLPPRDLGIELVNDFFATINLLCPLLHRPSFYREVFQFLCIA
jgi:hypothetical protein